MRSAGKSVYTYMIARFTFMIKRLVFATLLMPWLVGAALAQDAGCPANHVFAVMTPAPPQAQSSVYDFLNADIAPGADLLLLGDSIANQLAGESDLFEQLGAKQPLRFSGGGDGIQTALYRLQAREDLLRGENPDRILIVLGTNNLAFETCAIELGYKAYFELVKDYWPDAKIYVLPILPRGPYFNTNEDRRQELNSFLANHQTEYGYYFINIKEQELVCGIKRDRPYFNLTDTFKAASEDVKQCGNRSLAELQDLARGLNPDGSLDVVCTASASLTCSNYRPDNTHLSPAGIAILADQVAAAMR